MIFSFDTKSNNPFYNLAFEEFLLKKKPKGDIYIMLWQNFDTVVIGRHQNIFEEVNIDFALKNNINIVRRNSGGGAVYHDLGNLNYTFIVDYNSDYSFERLAMPIINVLKNMELDVSFSGRNDICIDGFKISGTAKYLKYSKILYHGTLLINSDIDTMSSVLTSASKYDNLHSIPSIRSRVKNIQDFFDKNISIPILCENIINNFDSVIPAELSKDELKIINHLEKSKYNTELWNYGNNHEFNFIKRKRFKGGTVIINALIEENIIKYIEFQGDFFAQKDLKKLQRKLSGICLDKNLLKVLSDNKAGEYIKDVSTQDIFSLFELNL